METEKSHTQALRFFFFLILYLITQRLTLEEHPTSVLPNETRTLQHFMKLHTTLGGSEEKKNSTESTECLILKLLPVQYFE